MPISKWSNEQRYLAQSSMVRDALAAPDHALEHLLKLMRGKGEAALYLSGGRLDNDFCFGSADLGMLLSTLPEDAAKAGEPGYHPGSTEVYVTFQGSLELECLEEGIVVTKRSGDNAVVVLPPGQCHRVKAALQTHAASLIAKTSLRAKPGVIRCAECGYFANPVECPLHRQWKAERQAS